MSENRKKWSAYFMELLVVIIGISIAFALENWSEKKRNTQNEINYLNSLAKDIEEDAQEIQSILDSSDVIIQHVSELFSYLYGNRPVEGIQSYHITSTYTAPHFNAKDGTYTSLLNSGSIGIIENYELKSRLTNLYNVHYDEILRMDDFIKGLVNSQIYPYMLSQIQFNRNGQGIVDSTPLKQNVAINMIGSYWNFLRQRNTEYLKVKEECELTLTAIRNELDLLD